MNPVESPRVLGRITLPHEAARQRLAEEEELSKLPAIMQLYRTLIASKHTGEVKVTLYRGSISREVVVTAKRSVKLELPEGSTGQTIQDSGTIASR